MPARKAMLSPEGWFTPAGWVAFKLKRGQAALPDCAYLAPVLLTL